MTRHIGNQAIDAALAHEEVFLALHRQAMRPLLYQTRFSGNPIFLYLASESRSITGGNSYSPPNRENLGLSTLSPDVCVTNLSQA
jgi:hypothetical protein